MERRPYISPRLRALFGWEDGWEDEWEDGKTGSADVDNFQEDTANIATPSTEQMDIDVEGRLVDADKAQPGDLVEFQGLQSTAHLNGTKGYLVEFSLGCPSATWGKVSESETAKLEAIITDDSCCIVLFFRACVGN